MKKAVIIVIFLIGALGFSQNKSAKASLKVNGVCIMCKKRIETNCIKIKGVKTANWNVNTHELKLIYNENKTNLDSIKKSVLAIGHDVEDLMASDKAYNKLHGCCKYRDEEIIDDHKKKS